MTADEHLAAGDPAAARAELVAAIKRAPSDQGARMFLFQLLCVLGEWDRALTHLRVLGQLSPEAQMLATVYGQAIAAEKVRAAALAGAGEIPVLGGDEPWVAVLGRSLGALGRGATAEAEDLRDRAFDAAPDTPGEADGEAFEWIADADPRFGPVLEAIVNGRWGLLPFAAIERLDLEPVSDLRDLVWRPAQLRLRAGGSVAVLLPARYPGSEAAGPEFQLARATVWRDGGTGQVGIGQRLFDLGGIGGESGEAGILSLKTIAFR